ncbi:MAG: hypothetical protein ABI807_13195 [Sporichthyaceae bacterium]
MLDRLQADRAGVIRAIYLDVDLDETTRRHAERPQAVEFTVEDMRAWYSGADPLGWARETVLPQALSLDVTVGFLSRPSRAPNREPRVEEVPTMCDR